MSRYRRKQAYRRRQRERRGAAFLNRLVYRLCQRGLQALRDNMITAAKMGPPGPPGSVMYNCRCAWPVYLMPEKQ